MERVVEQVAVAQRERGDPVQVREDPERNGLTEAAHQYRANDAEHQVQPDRSREGPGDVRAHAERASAAVHAQPPEQQRTRQEEPRHEPPTAVLQTREVQSIARCRRLEREPRQQADELDDVPIHRGQHVQSDDLEGDEAAQQREQSRRTQIEGSDLGVAEATEQVHEERLAAAYPGASRQRYAFIGGCANLDARKDILIFGHTIPLAV